MSVLLSPVVLIALGTATGCCPAQDLGKWITGIVVVDPRAFQPSGAGSMLLRSLCRLAWIPLLVSVSESWMGQMLWPNRGGADSLQLYEPACLAFCVYIVFFRYHVVFKKN